MKSPFKFLAPYTKLDSGHFFGRDKEIRQLYQLSLRSRLILVYGRSGTGKTSLVQCGLSNKFDYTDWLPVFIRREENVVESVKKHFEQLLKDASKPDWLENIEQLNNQFLRPPFLIFDQFEELFLLGSESEQTVFFENISKIVNSEVACTVMFIMREDFIARLSSFENYLPTVFDQRLRVEPLNYRDALLLVGQLFESHGIEVENPQHLIPRIIENSKDENGDFYLPFLQIYIDQLYQNGTPDDAGSVKITESSLSKTGSLEQVLIGFLDQRISAIQNELNQNFKNVEPDFVIRVLNHFSSFEGTKVPLSTESAILKNLPAEPLNFTLKALENGRILNFEKGIYELAHDILAKRIRQTRKKEDQELLEIIELVKDRMTAASKTQTSLNAREINLVEHFKKRLELHPDFKAEHWEFVNVSKRKNLFKKSAIWGSVFAVLLIGAYILYLQIAAAQQLIDAAKMNFEQGYTYYTLTEESKAARSFEKVILGLKEFRSPYYKQKTEAYTLKASAAEKLGDLFLKQTPDLDNRELLEKSRLCYEEAANFYLKVYYSLPDSVKSAIPTVFFKKQTAEVGLGDTLAAQESTDQAARIVRRFPDWKKYVLVAERQNNFSIDYLGAISNTSLAAYLLLDKKSFNILEDSLPVLPFDEDYYYYYNLIFQNAYGEMGLQNYYGSNLGFERFLKIMDNQASLSESSELSEEYKDFVAFQNAYWGILCQANTILLNIYEGNIPLSLEKYERYKNELPALRDKFRENDFWKSELLRVEPYMDANYALALLYADRWEEAEPIFEKILSENKSWCELIRQTTRILYFYKKNHPDLQKLELLMAKYQPTAADENIELREVFSN